MMIWVFMRIVGNEELIGCIIFHIYNLSPDQISERILENRTSVLRYLEFSRDTNTTLNQITNKL